MKQTAKLAQLSRPTIYHWFDVFRSHLPNDQDILEHLVQLDEAYFGGKSGRALFLGKQIGSKRLAYEVLSHTNPNREHAWKFLHSYVAADTVLNTDGAAIYKHIKIGGLSITTGIFIKNLNLPILVRLKVCLGLAYFYQKNVSSCQLRQTT